MVNGGNLTEVDGMVCSERKFLFDGTGEFLKIPMAHR